MNIFDIITLVIFFGSVLICTLQGFLKIISKLGAFFLAMIISKWFGGMLGEWIFGDAIGEFSSVLGVAMLFVVLSLLFRIIFFALNDMIIRLFHTKALDKLLGALAGAVGGFATVYFFAWGVQLFVALVSVINADSYIIPLAHSTRILKYFM